MGRTAEDRLMYRTYIKASTSGNGQVKERERDAIISNNEIPLLSVYKVDQPKIENTFFLHRG